MKRKTTNDIPDWADVYVFGSAVHSQTPNDLDLLVVYELSLCPPEKAREEAEHLAEKLARNTNLQPHVVVLSKAEEQDVKFIQSEKGVEFSKWRASGNHGFNSPAKLAR